MADQGRPTKAHLECVPATAHLQHAHLHVLSCTTSPCSVLFSCTTDCRTILHVLFPCTMDCRTILHVLFPCTVDLFMHNGLLCRPKDKATTSKPFAIQAVLSHTSTAWPNDSTLQSPSPLPVARNSPSHDLPFSLCSTRPLCAC